MTNLEMMLEYLGLVREQFEAGEGLSNAIENAEVRWGWKYGFPRGGSLARSDYWHPMYEIIWEAANQVGKHNPCWAVATELRDIGSEDKEDILDAAERNIRWLLEESPLKSRLSSTHTPK